MIKFIKHLYKKITRYDFVEYQNQSLQEDVTFYKEILRKLVSNCVEIKPVPEGDIKDRLAIFVGKEVKDLNFSGQTLIILNKMVAPGNMNFTNETRKL